MLEPITEMVNAIGEGLIEIIIWTPILAVVFYISGILIAQIAKMWVILLGLLELAYYMKALQSWNAEWLLGRVEKTTINFVPNIIGWTVNEYNELVFSQWPDVLAVVGNFLGLSLVYAVISISFFLGFSGGIRIPFISGLIGGLIGIGGASTDG